MSSPISTTSSRNIPSSFKLGSHEISIPADKQDRLMDVDIPSFPMVPFDYLLYTAYEDLGKEQVRLGVVLGQDVAPMRQDARDSGRVQLVGLTAECDELELGHGYALLPADGCSRR